jgi:hypothetical protein
VRVENLGTYQIVTARLPGGEQEQIVKAKLGEDADIQRGPAFLHFPAERLRIYLNGRAL